MFKIILSLCAVLVLTGCTSGAVSDLAAKTGDNATNLAIGLQSFTRTSAAEAKRRAAAIAHLTALVAESNLRLERTIAISAEVGLNTSVKNYNDLRQRADQWAQKEKEQKNLGIETQQSLLADQRELKSKADALLTLAGQLRELSKSDSGASQVKFLINFATDVTTELKEAKKAASADQGGN